MTVVRVLPDVPAVDRVFDYELGAIAGSNALRIGTVVRVPLAGHSVRGWILGIDVDPVPGMALLQVSKVVGIGPDESVIDLCRWAAWRWGGRLATLLRLATHDRSIGTVPPLRVRPATTIAPKDRVMYDLAQSLLLFGEGSHVLLSSPSSDGLDVALAASAGGQALIVIPGVVDADRIARSLRSCGAAVARWPMDWSDAAGGATVVGGRGSIFAPMPELSSIVVIDEHDETLQNEGSPTWHARELAVERARRAGIPCILLSPCPSLEALSSQGNGLDGPEADLQPRARLSRRALRRGWAPLIVIDRRGDDAGRSGLFSSQLVEAIRGTLEEGASVACVLNRTGRARLVICRSCSSIAACSECDAAVTQDDELNLVCARCGAVRPPICAGCGSTALALLRTGVSRAREELEALVREPVAAVTAASVSAGAWSDTERVFIGTTALLNRPTRFGLVAFLDFDQELLAPRYRASEEALNLLMLGSRRVQGRSGGGKVVVQTRMPEHEAIEAAVLADPFAVSRAELARRRMLGFPPIASVAIVGRDAAPEYIRRLGNPLGVDVVDSGDGRWLLRSTSPGVLQNALAAVDRPPGRLQLQVDPARFVR